MKLLILAVACSMLAVYIPVPPGPPPVNTGPSRDPWNVPSHVLREDGTLWYMGPGQP